MTINKNIYVSIILFFLVINSTYAQQQTTYQKKILEIEKKYVKKILIGEGKWSQRSEAELFYANADYLNAVLAIGLMGTPQYIEGFKNEMKQAEKLKTTTDFQREKEAKLKKENKENEQKQQKKEESFERSDIGIIKKNIKNTFEKWNQKGEFEKQTDYENRLENQSQNAFDQTCIEQIKRKIENYNNYYLNRELLPYNADNEFFNVKFKVNNIDWLGRIDIPIANAENFKNNWTNLKIKINNYDWCFVENTLCPTLITLSDENEKYQFALPLQNQKEITYSFEDLGIDNLYLKGYLFKYTDAKKIDIKIAQEKLEKDSLLIMSYNNKLETAFQNYNSQLLTNNYNIEKKVVLDYNKISNKEDDIKNIEGNYKESLELLTRNYNTIKNELETSFDIAYDTENKLFATKEEFEKYYIQGKDNLLTEIKKRKEKQEEERILNYLNLNSKFIESIDFQQEKRESVGSALGRGLFVVATNTNVSVRDYTNENQTRKDILSLINKCDKKSYYSKVLDFVFDTNKDLNKKWNKDGQFFINKAELYEAYTIGDYKQILKEKK